MRVSSDEVRAVIEVAAKDGRLISWKEIALSMGRSSRSAQSIAKAVSTKLWIEDVAANRPILAAICVRADNRLPGRGYWGEVFYVNPVTAKNGKVISVPAWATSAWQHQTKAVWDFYGS